MCPPRFRLSTVSLVICFRSAVGARCNRFARLVILALAPAATCTSNVHADAGVVGGDAGSRSTGGADGGADASRSADAAAAVPSVATGTAASTVPLPSLRAFSLQDCLVLTDRNHPNLWAARARLAQVHAQLEEAETIPWFQWSASATFGVLPKITGTPFFTSSPQDARNVSSFDGVQPAFAFDISGVLPLYTFGKITAGRKAAEAGVSASQWDLERVRRVARNDVRKAFFGLMLVRDAKHVAKDALSRLDRAIAQLKDKLDRNDPTVNDIDKLRLEIFREEIYARMGEVEKNEAFALAALRFMTGIQTGFDIPDVPLTRPNRPLVDLAQYLMAARLHRPEVNMARAGILARERLVELQRARFFPDFGLGVGASFASSPSATRQIAAWTNDPFNKFFYYFGFGAKWNLDILPNAARVAQAEAQLEEMRATLRFALGGVAVEVEKAYASAKEAKSREEAWDRAEKKAKEWIATVQMQIDLGTREETALLEPLRSYGNARVQHLSALMDLNNAMSELALASGWDNAAPTGP